MSQYKETSPPGAGNQAQVYTGFENFAVAEHGTKDPSLYAGTPMTAVETLSLSDIDRRKLVGASFSEYLIEQGYSGVVYTCNINAALPPSTRAQLQAHGVPPTAYGGRMSGIAMSVYPSWPVKVVSSEPMDAEVRFTEKLANFLGCEPPQLVPDESHIGPDDFVYPFMGDREVVDSYPGRTLPDSRKWHSKSGMRQLLRDMGEGESVSPGVEIFYEPGESKESYYERIYTALRDESRAAGIKLWLKHAHTASGLKTERYNPEDLAEEGAHVKVFADLDGIFVDPDTGDAVFDDLVIEHHVEFGDSPTGWGDYNLRGMLTPKGDYVPLFAGRSINNDIGEYVGMVGAKCDDPTQLANIGLDPATLAEAARVNERIAHIMYAGGYFGPVSTDFFSRQFDPTSPVWERDFNMREGGTSFCGVATAECGDLWPGSLGVLDTELNIDTGAPLTDDALETMVDTLYENKVLPYSTTFLRFPKTDQETGRTSYTLKVLAGQYTPATTTQEVIDSMRSLANSLNGLGVPGVTFRSPL